MPRLAFRHLLPALTAAALAVTATAHAGSGSGPMPHGPDVASYQHPNGAGIDWSRVHGGAAAFAFVKATEGNDYRNPYFASDYAAVHKAGMVRSAYHYARPHADLQTAKEQAAYFVKVAGTDSAQGDLPLTLDLEETGGLTPSQLIGWTQTFLDAVKAATHRTVLVYTYPYFWQTAMANSTAFTSYPLWIASYRNDGPKTPLPGGWKNWTFWQYTSSGAEAGIQGSVDESLFSGSQAQLAALADPTSPSGAAGPPPLPIPIPVTLPHLPSVPGTATTHDNHQP
ncbi:MAG: lysozyme [Mycobacteriales bacterium]